MAKRGVNLAVLAQSGNAMAAMSKATKEKVEKKIDEADNRPGEPMVIKLADIEIRKQVRLNAEEGLEGLVEAIREAGRVYVPIHVIPGSDAGKWILLGGERRVRASLRLNLETIPANVVYDVSEEDARTYQVQENAERKPLTTIETVIGIIEDYKLGGLERAQKVWGHSQPWVAKRVAFDGYRKEIKDLLFNGNTEDFELLSSLEGLSKTEGADKQYQRFLERIQAGKYVSREEIRLAHQSFKNRVSQSGASTDEDQAGGGEVDVEEVGEGDGLERGLSAADSTPGGDEGLSSTGASTQASGLEVKFVGIDGSRAALFNKANSLKSTIEKLKREIKSNKLSVEDEEWVLWCALIDVVSPALALLGPNRSSQALKTLAADLKKSKGRTVADLLKEIHEVNGELTPSPTRPEHWLVMTDPVGASE